MKSFTTLSNLYTNLSQNNSTENISLGNQLINDAHRYLLQKYFNNEQTFTIPTVASQQAYYLPPNYSKSKDLTIIVGQLKWTPIEVLSRVDWDRVNFIPYTSDIPSYYFVYNGQVNIFPIPASSGNTITFNYKVRVPDLTIDDYTTGTVSATVGSTTITGSGTTWQVTKGNNESRWIRIDFPSGDEAWYQIQSITSTTSLTLYSAYYGSANVSGGTYTIGQMPLLIEDFHDLLTYRPLDIYFSSIRPDANRATEFKTLYDEGIKRLDEYAGSKSTSVVLDPDVQFINPNLFPYSS